MTSKEVTQKEHKGQGLWVCLKLLHGDLKQVREENPHLITPSTAIARKMGFPDIILPGKKILNFFFFHIKHNYNNYSLNSNFPFKFYFLFNL